MAPSRKRLLVPNHIGEQLRHFHPDLKAGVKAALRQILEDPPCGKPLKDELGGLRAYKVKRFRIIYRASGNVVGIVAIGPRRVIYEETFKLLMKTEDS